MKYSKILIVEDSDTQRAVYKDVLEKEGYSIIEARDGEEGLRKVKTELPDLIISDLAMPKMSGFEMIRAIKIDDKTKYIPIICVSATYNDIADKLKMLVDFGAEEYFYATENMEELLAKVIVMLRIRKLYLELLEKNKQLKQFNDVAVDRELKMIELKRRIRELEGELAKYKK